MNWKTSTGVSTSAAGKGGRAVFIGAIISRNFADIGNRSIKTRGAVRAWRMRSVVNILAGLLELLVLAIGAVILLFCANLAL